MAMVSVIYTGSARTKLKTQLYREYIEEWRSSNRDYFISEITSVLVGDWRKKVLKKFEKDGINFSNSMQHVISIQKEAADSP